MSGKMTRHAYDKCIKQNLEWLEKQPDTLERRHIEMIVKKSADFEYGSNGKYVPKLDACGRHLIGD